MQFLMAFVRHQEALVLRSSTKFDENRTISFSIMGDEGWGQVSSKLRVVSENKADTYFGGIKPGWTHFDPRRLPQTLIVFFNAVNKPWYIMGDGCGQISSKLFV